MSRKPIVCILAPEGLPVPPSQGGSVQIYIHSVTQATSASHLHRIVISPSHAFSAKSPLSQHHIRVQGATDTYLQRALRKMQSVHPDIIQIENRPSWLPSVRKGFPHAKIILNLHSITFLELRNLKWTSKIQLLQGADCITCNSHYLAKYVQRMLMSKDISRGRHTHKTRIPPVEVIYPGVNLSQFQVKSAKARHRPLRLLFVGRVIHQKGLHLLLSAVEDLGAKNVPVELTIVGKTPPWERQYRKQLRAKVAAKKLPVSFVGFVSPERLTHYYQKADLFLCPSQKTEAFGLVNVEALASGLPIVASQLGGIQEIVSEEVGILVHPHSSASAFTHAIHKIYQMTPTEYQKLSNGARNRATRFTWKRTARHFERVYMKLYSVKEE